jgi:hypothetical protein
MMEKISVDLVDCILFSIERRSNHVIVIGDNNLRVQDVKEGDNNLIYSYNLVKNCKILLI